MTGFFKMRISKDKMDSVLFAIFKTGAKLTSSFCLALKGYTRKQVSGFSVEVIVEVADDKVAQFNELAGVVLQTGEEYQGKVHLN